MRRIADRFDAADEVRIVGAATDLTFSIAGRHGDVDAGTSNMPAGEVFYSPVEDSANGVVTFGEYPGWYGGHQVQGIRFRFEDGLILEASSETDEDFLLTTLDSDEVRAAWASSGSAATRGSTARTGTRSSTRRFTARSTSRSGQGFPFLGGKNEASSTGTSSRAPQRRRDLARRRLPSRRTAPCDSSHVRGLTPGPGLQRRTPNSANQREDVLDQELVLQLRLELELLRVLAVGTVLAGRDERPERPACSRRSVDRVLVSLEAEDRGEELWAEPA